MATVETLEVRFQANIGGLSASISYLIGRIGQLNAAAISARAAIGNLGAGASMRILRLNDATQASAKNQTKLTSKLKNTSRALRGVAASARAATDGIGLHRLDEINLVGEREARKKSGGGTSGGGSGGAKEAKDALRNLETIWERLSKFGRRAGEVCKDLFDQFAGAFRKIDDFTGGMFSNIGSALATDARNIAQKFVRKLSEGLSASDAPAASGGKLVSRFASAISAGLPRIRSAAAGAAAGAVFANTENYNSAYSAGANLSNGFANGISSKISSIVAAAKNAASSAVSKLKKLLKIASPSRVTYAMGGYFGEGVANGIQSTVQMAEAGAAALSGAAVRAVRTANIPMEDAGAAARGTTGDTNIVLPLTVDGIKLGEAAIRGINRVTRSAGRVMLEL